MRDLIDDFIRDMRADDEAAVKTALAQSIKPSVDDTAARPVTRDDDDPRNRLLIRKPAWRLPAV
jgi:hypothetical protein